MQKLWFKAKTYGWGWTPCSWEGWLVTAVCAGTIVLLATRAETAYSPVDLLLGTTIPIIVIVGLLILICVLTGEKPGWKWGNK